MTGNNTGIQMLMKQNMAKTIPSQYHGTLLDTSIPVDTSPNFEPA